MASESTSWPEGGVADGVKNWLTTFYGAADAEGLEAAEIFANHYSEDAVLAGPNPLIGRKAIHEWRKSAWNTVTYRKRSILRVFKSKNDGTDIMVIGELESTLKNGNSFKMPFTSRLVFRLDARGDAQATLCEVWADQSPAVKAAKVEGGGMTLAVDDDAE